MFDWLREITVLSIFPDTPNQARIYFYCFSDSVAAIKLKNCSIIIIIVNTRNTLELIECEKATKRWNLSKFLWFFQFRLCWYEYRRLLCLTSKTKNLLQWFRRHVNIHRHSEKINNNQGTPQTHSPAVNLSSVTALYSDGECILAGQIGRNGKKKRKSNVHKLRHFFYTDKQRLFKQKTHSVHIWISEISIFELLQLCIFYRAEISVTFKRKKRLEIDTYSKFYSRVATKYGINSMNMRFIRMD